MKTFKNNIGIQEDGAGESKLMKLLEDELKDIYWLEKALTEALPEMIKNTTSEKLVNVLEIHLKETETHIQKVEKVFEIVGKKPVAKKCESMAGLIQETQKIITDSKNGAMCDAGIILTAQKVEHYEIASYGALKSFAQTLGLKEAVTLLNEILEQEKSTDRKLTEIAESDINLQAAENNYDY